MQRNHRSFLVSVAKSQYPTTRAGNPPRSLYPLYPEQWRLPTRDERKRGTNGNACSSPARLPPSPRRSHLPQAANILNRPGKINGGKARRASPKDLPGPLWGRAGLSNPCSHGNFGSPRASLPSSAGGNDFPPTLLASVPPSMLHPSLGPVEQPAVCEADQGNVAISYIVPCLTWA